MNNSIYLLLIAFASTVSSVKGPTKQCIYNKAQDGNTSPQRIHKTIQTTPLATSNSWLQITEVHELIKYTLKAREVMEM